MTKNTLPKAMRSAQMTDYGSYNVIKINQVPIPVLESTHVLVKIHGSSINPLDCKLREGLFKSLIFDSLPRTLGFDVVGEVVAMGSLVKHFRVGDRIIAKSMSLPGGAHAEYMNLPERICAVLPESIDFLTAAGFPQNDFEPRTNGSRMDPEWIPNAPRNRTQNGFPMEPEWTSNRSAPDRN